MNYPSSSFKALLAATFTASFNEVAIRAGIFLLIASQTSDAVNVSMLFLALAVFPTLPSILLSPFVGLIADKYGKPVVIRTTKLLEFILVIFGAYFLARDELRSTLFVALLLGVTTSFFTPVKYAIIPELVDIKDLSKANGHILFSKYSAYLLVLIILGVFVLTGTDVPVLLASFTSALAAIGLMASLFVQSRISNREEQWPSWSRVRESWKLIVANRELFLAMISFAVFLTIGAIFQLSTSILLPGTAAGLSQTWTTLLLALLCAGIASGAVFAGRISLGKVEIGLVPIGAFGVALSLLACAFVLPNRVALAAFYFMSGACGGAAVVPLNSLYQMKSPPERRGAFLGISHAFSQCIMLAVSLVVLAMHSPWSPDPRLLFVLAAIATVSVSAVALKHTPVALVRCVNWIFTHTIYRIRVFGAENAPAQGGALLICNHISYFDPLLISASLQRSVRFLISRRLFNIPILRRALIMIRAIPISNGDKPKELVASIHEAREALLKGQLVCVFAEGRPSRVGHMLRFRRGLERILRDVDVPIIPIYIDQTWGSLFDHKEGKWKLKFPKEIPYPASVTFGKPMPSSSSVFEVRQTISEIGTTAFSQRKRESQFLHIAFLNEAKSHPFRRALVESSGKRVPNIRALTGAFILGRVFASLITPDERNLGIWLPPCIAAALTNLALLMKGLIPVNLNYTASKEALDSAIRQGEIRHVITSRLFASKLAPPENVELIYLEDIMQGLSRKTQIFALLRMLLTPRLILQRKFLSSKDSHEDMATIVFSSGSTGIPKGVVLSHGNISSNVESMYNALNITRGDMLVGVLPFFHSFGLTTCLWLPLLAGVRVVYHFSPLDAEAIGDMVEREKATVLLGTPTFLYTYIRRIPREKFASLRWIIVGAEKLRNTVAAAFTNTFGVIPFEGYGCTELSPVAMINVPDVKEPGRDQIGNKPGTVGHPIPGVAVKVLNTETSNPVSPGEMGVLLVKGPNVMKGYLNDPVKTAEVIWDGWYVTGDLASLDQDGFVTIHDRISRFSKIGGEMVPHQGLEDAIQRAIGEVEPMCVVSGVFDDKKGERLIVMHTTALDARELLKKLTEMGLPNLWRPRSEDFYQIEALPTLGSGKLDLQAVKKLAMEKTGTAAA